MVETAIEKEITTLNAEPQNLHAAVLDGVNADAVRRRRMIFRAWHRGIREMDLLLGTYVDRHIASLSVTELDALEHLMEFEDNDLLRFFTGEAILPKEIDRDLFYKVKQAVAKPVQSKS